MNPSQRVATVLHAWLGRQRADRQPLPEDVTALVHELVDVLGSPHEVVVAAEAERDRAAFLAQLAHELRTPLTAILGFARVVRHKLAPLLERLSATAEGREQRQIATVMENLEIIIAEGERMNSFITKGVDTPWFKTVPESVGHDAPHATPAAAILVVDDEINIRRLLQLELEAAGYAVQLAACGAEALAWLKHSTPGLVILDVMMPGMNGYDLASVLRSEAQTRSIPILILSVWDDQPALVASHGDRFLAKPFDTADLLRLVGEMTAPGFCLTYKYHLGMTGAVTCLASAGDNRIDPEPRA
jgi:CheY-like chemotaxis protein